MTRGGEENISNADWINFNGGLSETHPSMEIYNEQKKGDNKMVSYPYYGEENAEKKGMLKEWEHQPFGSVVEYPEKYVSFNHVTTAEDKMSSSKIVIMEGNKEFGQGFYTTSASDLDASGILA